MIAGARVVVKASGLAAGKGVVLPDTVDEAVDLANDTTYGLAAAVFSRDSAKVSGARWGLVSKCHVNEWAEA